MRLSIPVETDELRILNGPGATELLKAALHLLGIGGHVMADLPGYPVDFTVQHPTDQRPIRLKFELIEMFDQGTHYLMTGLVPGNPKAVSILYSLAQGDKIRGSIKDKVDF